jgi:hypothetical protein
MTANNTGLQVYRFTVTPITEKTIIRNCSRRCRSGIPNALMIEFHIRSGVHYCIKERVWAGIPIGPLLNTGRASVALTVVCL